MAGFWDGSGISWTICKQSAPLPRQIATPTPHRSIFTVRMLFLAHNQHCQSTEGIQALGEILRNLTRILRYIVQRHKIALHCVLVRVISS